jgi:hypothetical protein
MSEISIPSFDLQPPQVTSLTTVFCSSTFMAPSG